MIDSVFLNYTVNILPENQYGIHFKEKTSLVLWTKEFTI